MSRKMFKYASLCLVLLLPAFFTGCGSDNKEGNLGGVGKVSETACAQCHSTAREPLTSAFIYDQYYQSPHYLNGVGCQDCHGGGAQHNGVGPIPYPKPGQEQCATCHDGEAATDIAQYADSKHANALTEDGEQLCNRCHTHEGAVLAAVNGYTGDKNFLNLATGAGRNFAPPEIPTAKAPQCTTCHEMHGGKIREVKTRNGSGNLVLWDPNNNGKSDQFDFCTSCHLYQQNSGGNIIASGTVASGTDPFYHDTAWWRIIASTHYDNPTTATTASGTTIEGYVLRKNTANPCFDCHGHESKTNTGNLTRNASSQYVLNTSVEPTIYTEWAKSGHAGGLLKAKYAAQDAYPKKSDGTYNRDTGMTDVVLAAGSTKASGGDAWGHYDWDSSFKADGTDADTYPDKDRVDCQMCHTSTGASNFFKNPSGYDPAKNDFSHLQGWSGKTTGKLSDASTWGVTTSSPQNELLYCWGCHSDAGKGVLYAPGAIKLAYNVDGAKPTLPDRGNSNVCINCHSARGNMDNIATLAAANPTTAIDPAAKKAATNTHYFAAAATIFQATTRVGYQYKKDGASLNYADPTYYKHNTLGCVDCHMPESNHSFEVVTKNDSGVITAINAQATCNTCHTGAYTMTAAILEEEAEGFEQALDVLQATIAVKKVAVFDQSLYPYFFIDTDADGVADASEVASANAFYSWGDQGGYGAAHNFNYLKREPGAFAHNRYYAKRLIFDSLDWLDNGAIDGTISIDATTYPEAAKWFGAPAGTSGSYTASRP